jgi:uncharacterized SAM-binding protein YcdF (DUF218 family)
VAVAVVLAAALAGCSTDAVPWGSGGARVIETTEKLIQAAGFWREHRSCLCRLEGGVR